MALLTEAFQELRRQADSPYPGKTVVDYPLVMLFETVTYDDGSTIHYTRYVCRLCRGHNVRFNRVSNYCAADSHICTGCNGLG